MEKEFIPYEQALALKELGFRESCFAYYNNHSPKNNHQRGFIISQYSVQDHNEENEGDNLICSAPLYQQAFRFFREEYNMLSTIYSNASGWCFEYLDNEGGTHRYDSGYTGDCEMSGAFTSYEKAELACLKKLIEIVKTK